MVKILAFPSLRGKNSKSVAPGPGEDLPLVSATADGRIVVTPLQRDRRGRGDWTNQELADLYRVEGLLIQANLRVSSARGVTDEGDPWFVFLREDGDVFVHLARIDGGYVLDSPGLSEVLYGADFPELIKRFVSDVAAKAAAPTSDNVISLRPRMLHDQTIRLHPAVMLGALIWSLYVASDDFVGMAHAMEEMDGDAGALPGPLDVAASALALSPELAVSQLNAALDQQVHSYGAPPDAGAAAGVTDAGKGSLSVDSRNVASGSSGSIAWGHGIAASLAAIAIGYGFLQVTEVSETADGESVSLVSTSSNDAIALSSLSSEQGQAEVSGDRGSATTTEDLLSHHAPDQLELAALDVEVAVLMHDLVEQDNLLALQARFVEGNSEVPVEAAAPKMVKVAPARKVEATAATSAPAAATAPEAASSKHSSAAVVEVASLSDSQILLSLVNGHVGFVANHKLGDVTVSTSLDQDDLATLLPHLRPKGEGMDGDAVIAVEPVIAPIPSVPAERAPTYSPAYLQYDDRAKDFVARFIERAGQIELVQFDSHIVLVDMTAIDEATDVAYTVRWVTEDGSVISTIGHLQHFLEYGIA